MRENTDLTVNLHPALGRCGIDCCLCSRYRTLLKGGCPGCSAPGFFEKRPPCPFINCCVKKKKLDNCSECAEFPCPRFDNPEAREAFVTKRRRVANLTFLKKAGLSVFLEQQEARYELLKKMLSQFNDSQSKGYYCLAVALLPIDDLKSALAKVELEIENGRIDAGDKKTSAILLRNLLQAIADRYGIMLKLRKKTGV